MVAPEPFAFKTELNLKSKDGLHEKQTVDLQVNLPHDWIVALHEHDQQHVLGATKKREFWEQQGFESKPQLKDNPYYSPFDVKADAPYPLMVHGDAAPHSETDSIQVVSMRSILTDVSVKLSQFLLLALPKGCKSTKTGADIWKVLVWSFKALALGLHPHADHNGVNYKTMKNRTRDQERRCRLAGKALPKAVVFVIGGDIEWLCQEFGFPYAMSNTPCPAEPTICMKDQFCLSMTLDRAQGGKAHT